MMNYREESNGKLHHSSDKLRLLMQTNGKRIEISKNERRMKNDFFNDNSTSNDNDLDCLNNNLVDSNLTDEQIDNYSEEQSIASDFICIDGTNYSRSNLGEEEEDEVATEMDELLDKNECKDQKIVEVLRQLVRDCTNPDPSKRPSAFEVTDRLQPFLK